MNVLRFLLLALLLHASASAVWAVDGTYFFTLDLPFSANAATPAWLAQPVVGPGPFTSLELPITPPDPDASLLVTVFFQDQAGGFLRISWQAAATVAPEDDQTLPGPGETALSSVLCDNFFEGIGMSNQRTLLIPAQAIKQPGSLCFQTGSATLGISRIEMDWVDSAMALSSPLVNDLMVTSADGRTRSASELDGQPPLAQDPAWHGRIVDVPVTDTPLRIEEGLDFSVQIDSVPTLARISLKEAGLPWGQHLAVWVNDQRTGVLIPATPPLADGGFQNSPAGTYVGWREGTFWVPVSALAAGANTLLFSAEPDAPPTLQAEANAPLVPLAVKDVVLQLAYAESAPPAIAPAVSTAVTTNPTLSAPLSLPVSTPALDPNSLSIPTP